MSDCDKMLARLSDGRPHCSLDFRTLDHLTPNSRAAELRARGYQIACWSEPHPNAKGGRRYMYQLLAPLSRAETSPAQSRGTSESHSHSEAAATPSDVSVTGTSAHESGAPLNAGGQRVEEMVRSSTGNSTPPSRFGLRPGQQPPPALSGAGEPSSKRGLSSSSLLLARPGLPPGPSPAPLFMQLALDVGRKAEPVARHRKRHDGLRHKGV